MKCSTLITINGNINWITFILYLIIKLQCLNSILFCFIITYAICSFSFCFICFVFDYFVSIITLNVMCSSFIDGLLILCQNEIKCVVLFVVKPAQLDFPS
eukprot:526606_1